MGELTREETDELFMHNIQEVNRMDIAAGSMIKGLIMELQRHNIYIKLNSAVEKGHKVNYIFIEGEQDIVFKIARALGFKKVTNDTLEVHND